MRIVDGTTRLDDAKALIVAYSEQLGRDLGFQGLDRELDDLEGKYAPPHGRLLLAVGDGGAAFGCVAYRHLDGLRCEMKRLYVEPGHRGEHAGRALAERIMAVAAGDGYREMVLDTIEPLRAAIGLYRSLGFEDCPAYYDNPMPDVRYMRREL